MFTVNFIYCPSKTNSRRFKSISCSGNEPRQCINTWQIGEVWCLSNKQVVVRIVNVAVDVYVSNFCKIMASFPENWDSFISRAQQLTRETLNFFLGVSCAMISTLAIDCLSHPDFSRESLRHSHFAVMWLVCSTDRKQNTNTIRKECCSDMSSRFFGGSVAWHPQKRLQRRLSLTGRKKQTRQDIKNRRHCFWDKGVKKSAQCLSLPPDHFRLHGNWTLQAMYFCKTIAIFSRHLSFSFS